MIDKAASFAERLKAVTKCRKLLSLASGNDNPHEAEAAMRQARALAAKHQIDLTTLRPLPVTESPIETAARMAAAFGGTIRQRFPGTDDEDYSKYAKPERGERKKPYEES